MWEAVWPLSSQSWPPHRPPGAPLLSWPASSQNELVHCRGLRCSQLARSSTSVFYSPPGVRCAWPTQWEKVMTMSTITCLCVSPDCGLLKAGPSPTRCLCQRSSKRMNGLPGTPLSHSQWPHPISYSVHGNVSELQRDKKGCASFTLLRSLRISV